FLDPASVSVVVPPAHGSVVVNPANGFATYTAVAGFSGTDTFQYTVADIHGAVSNPATVTIGGDSPTARDDVSDTDGTNPVTIDVLENDSDPDGPGFLDPASVAITQSPGHGGVSIDTSTGAITYTPNAGFQGTDTFRYTVADIHGAVSNPATV